jgi:poly(A) polymerase
MLPEIAAALNLCSGKTGGGKNGKGVPSVKQEDATVRERFEADLNTLDYRINNYKNIRRSEMIQRLVQEPLLAEIVKGPPPGPSFQELFKTAKELLYPITPPNVEVERAVKAFIRHYMP